jgi:hypothetical protein
MSVRYYTVTPTIVPAAYDDNDTIGGVNTVYSLTAPGKGVSFIGSATLVDKAGQKADLDIIFFSGTSAPTVSADNAAYDISDADALNQIGSISIAAADYIDSASNSTACKKGVSLPIPQWDGVNGVQNLYCVFVTRGTPTYVSASDLVLRIGFFE